MVKEELVDPKIDPIRSHVSCHIKKQQKMMTAESKKKIGHFGLLLSVL